AFQQTLAEPPPASARAAAWWPVVAQLETVTDAVTEAAVAARAGGSAPRPEDVERCVAAMQAIASQLRAGGSPEAPALDIPDDSPIESVAAAIRATQRVLAGPASEHRRRRRPHGRRRHGTVAGRARFEEDGHGSTQRR
ncbi:MAG: hypothetical protein J2P44_01755, partial [Candidatus Dormibacteraeota bacterium]|nr:hypothetical protein [Candidatus Dormibacteraeota bacterium]